MATKPRSYLHLSTTNNIQTLAMVHEKVKSDATHCFGVKMKDGDAVKMERPRAALESLGLPLPLSFHGFLN